MGSITYFVFASIPFGLATAPFIFTKLLQPLTKHWIAQRKRTLTCLDDGFGVAHTWEMAHALATNIKGDLSKCGFLINKDKSCPVPQQTEEFLGYVIDLVNGIFSVPQEKNGQSVDTVA